MSEANGFNSLENKRGAAKAELVQRWMDHISRNTDRFSSGDIQPKSDDARFSLMLNMPAYTDPETGKVTDIPQYRLVVGEALDQLGVELGADNSEGRQEEDLEKDLSGYNAEVVFRQATVSASPVSGAPYESPVDITVKITQPAEGYPDDVPGISAAITMTKSQTFAGGDAQVPAHSRPNL